MCSHSLIKPLVLELQSGSLPFPAYTMPRVHDKKHWNIEHLLKQCTWFSQLETTAQSEPVSMYNIQIVLLFTSKMPPYHQGSSPEYFGQGHCSTRWFLHLPWISHKYSLLSCQNYTAEFVRLGVSSNRNPQQLLSRMLWNERDSAALLSKRWRRILFSEKHTKHFMDMFLNACESSGKDET